MQTNVFPAAFKQGYLHLSSGYPDFLQHIKNILRHSFRQVNGAVFLVYLYLTDVLAGQPGFIADGADNVRRFDAMAMTYFDTLAFHPGFDRVL